MLKALRKKGLAKKVLWFVAVVVIISFGFFGKASILDNGSANYAGKIYGKKISINEFRKTYQEIQVQAIIHYGEDFNNAMINLEAETWNRLILLKDAKRQRIQVSDKEVVSVIEQYPFFQRDGQFDSLLYDNTLRYAFRIKARDFEESIRNTIKITKLKDIETQDVNLNEDEIFEDYKKQNEKTQTSYILVSSDQFLNDVTTDNTYLKQYFEEHKSDFLRPPSIKVDYVKIPFPEETSDKKDPEADDSKFEAYQKAEELYQRLLEKNANFEKTTQEYNVNIQTTDYFSIQKPIFTFGSFDALNTIFHLDVNEMSAPMETAQGMFIVRMKEKRDSYVPSFDEAIEDVKKTVKDNEAKRIARTKSIQYLEKIQEKLNDKKSFSEAAKELGLQMQQTPLFNRGQYLPIVGIEKDFQETAFALSPSKPLSDIIGTAKGYCILYQDTFVAADQNKFVEEKEDFKEKLLVEKKMQAFNDYFSRLKAEANLQSNLIQKEG